MRFNSAAAVSLAFTLVACGGKPAEEPYVMISQIATMYYFAHFLIILPILSMVERTKPLPNSISESVLHGEAAEAAPADLTGATPAQA